MTEQTLNHYAAPKAHVADVAPSEGMSELNVFGIQGRIGRLRYLAYLMAGMLVYGILSRVVIAAAGEDERTIITVASVLWLGLLWFHVITGVKRCHDLGISGWWSASLIVPLIMLVWAFVPGRKRANRFGPPPPPNNWGVRILGLLLPILYAGVILSVAIPAYNAYIAKAKARAAQIAPSDQQR
ncbi:DUF805 domain-containing protein [Roseateles chitinivorans]|uniref:DUF805 domain-containing protein n=1 Tax=Roseateles chitinivorans TaxID=2917965 RepID=UPI003D66B0F3